MLEQDSIYEAWYLELQRRLPECEFTTLDGGALLRKFSKRLFDQHFRKPRYTSIEPPLPGLPRLPLDQRWVELRLQEGLYFSGQELDPIQSVLERPDAFGTRKTNTSLQNMLGNTESYLIFGTPGAGKSTLVNWAARFLMTELRGPSIIPMIVPLRSFARWKKDHPDGDVFEFFWSSQLRLPAKHAEVFREFMIDLESLPEHSGLCRVLLDGWDEIPRDLLGDIEHEVERFRHTLPTLATSRPTHMSLSYLPERRFDIVPLPFESMRALMSEWFHRVGRPELEVTLCHHLDNHIEMRELAQNPYVLTLLCAVFAGVEGAAKTPDSRTELYREAVKLMVRYCCDHFGSQGFEFNADDVENSERTAYELLARSDASPFEFSELEISRLANDEGHLAQTWKHARLIMLAKEFEAIHSFLHPTIHEYLAGQELARRLKTGEANPVQAGTDPLWMRACVFAVNSVGPDNALWKSLPTIIENHDEFGVLVLRIASLLIEAKAQDGGVLLLGHDIRPILWRLFWEAPDPYPYASTLVQLCPIWAIDQAESEDAPTAETLPRINMLHDLMPLSSSDRLRLLNIQLRVKDSPEASVEPGVSHLLSFLDDTPKGPRNLETATPQKQFGTPVMELLKDRGLARPVARIQIARLRNHEAEEALTSEFRSAKDTADFRELLDAFEILGTLGVRNAIFERLQELKAFPDTLIHALRILQNFSIKHGADQVLQLLEHDPNREVRIEAALTVGGVISDESLRRLCHFARTTEPDFEVRKAAIQGLARSRAVWMVKDLSLEDFSERSEPSERLVVSGYLAAIAQTTPAGEAPSMLQSWIPPYFVRRLRSEDLNPIEVVHSAACSDIDIIRKEWHRLMAESDSVDLQAAVCEAIRRNGDKASVSIVTRTLKTLKKATEWDKLRYQATLTIAFLRPDLIPDLRPHCSVDALWRFSLETDTLVFPGRLVNAAEFSQSPPTVSDEATIVSFLNLSKEEVNSEWRERILRLLKTQKHDLYLAFVETGVKVDDLPLQRLHKELKIMYYVFVDHIDEYIHVKECRQNGTDARKDFRKVFVEKVGAEATGIGKTTFRESLTWKAVQKLLGLGKSEDTVSPTGKLQVKEGAIADKNDKSPEDIFIAAEEVEQQIAKSRIPKTSKKALLDQLRDSPRDADQLLKQLRVLQRKD